MTSQLSKFGDSMKGFYFRKSRQLSLEAALGRVESRQQYFDQAISRIEAKITDIEKVNSASQNQKLLGSTVEGALENAIFSHAVTLDAPGDNVNSYRHWYHGMEFSEDWTSSNFSVWSQVFDSHGKSFREGLEIGSFEGRSAVFFLEYLPQLHLTCVDLFEYTNEFFPSRKSSQTEFTKGARFDKNLRKYAGRYEKIVSSSSNALAQLVSQRRKFDFIYIDGSHCRDDVFIDALLSWKLLNVNGVIIFDDYFWGWEYKSSDRPKDAIEYFVHSHLDELKIVHKGAQFIIKRVV